MIVEAGMIAMAAIGIGLLIALLVFAMRGDTDKVVLCGMALLTGLSPQLAVIAAIVLFIVFYAEGNPRRAVFAVLGLFIGLALFMGVVAMLVAGGMIEGTLESELSW